MENEEVEIKEVEISEVEKVEVSPKLVDVVEQMESNPEKLKDVQKLAEEVLAQQEESLKQREQDLFNREVKATLKENGLEAYADIITATNSDDLAKVISKLNKIVLEQKVANGYIPKETNGTQDGYTQAIQNGDVKNAIGFKLANLFKK